LVLLFPLDDFIVRRTQFSDATTRESIRVVTHAEDTPSVRVYRISLSSWSFSPTRL